MSSSSDSVIQSIRKYTYPIIPKTYLHGDCKAWRSVLLQETGQRFPPRRCVMKKFIAALALISLIAIPTLTQTANAAPMSPASSSFGSNGY
jgi:hypothetical protein